MSKSIPRQPVTLLKVFGLDFSRGNEFPSAGSSSFWSRECHRLDEILHDAHTAYRLLMLAHHPDKPGGSNAQCAYINACFTRTKKIFANKGIVLC